MPSLSATLSGLQYGPEDDPHSVRCDGCCGYVPFEQCRVVEDEVWCPSCCAEVRFPEPVPAPSMTDLPPSPEHAGTCDCGVELTGCGELCPPCADLRGRAEAWQEGAVR